MTVYDALYFYGLMMISGFIVGISYSMFFDWVGWRQ